MMKTCVATLLAVLFATTSAWGGIVTFDPPKIDLGSEGGVAVFDVSLSVEELDVFDAANVIFGSWSLAIVDFVYDEAFTQLSAWVAPPTPAGFYPSEMFVRGFAPNGEVYGSVDVPFGTLTVNVLPFDPVLDEPQQHWVFVDSSQDAGTSSLIHDLDVEQRLRGGGAVNVVPEPAALTLLGLSTLGFLRRPRRRSS